MKKTSFIFVLFFALTLVATVTAQVERDQVAEQILLDELHAIEPNAVSVFSEATSLLDQDKNAEADSLFAEVLSVAPNFEAALRRRGYTQSLLGNRQNGLELTQKAIDLNRSTDNLTARVSILLGLRSEGFTPSATEISEALELSEEAWEVSGKNDEFAGILLAESLLQKNDIGRFEQLVNNLIQKFPDSLTVGYYNALILANNGNFSGSREELTRIQALGFPEDVVAELMSAMDAADNESYWGLGRFFKYLNIFLVLIVLWAAGLAALFFIGRSLSKKTLRLIEESDPNDGEGQAYESLRKLYRKVISVAGIYYYLSQPIVILIVLVAAAAVLVFFLWIGRIPIYLMLALVVVTALTIFYMVKSWVTRVKVEDPGRKLNENEAPQLWHLVREVAETIKTRPIDEIRLTHGTEVAVYERGSFRSKLTDNAERVLILGAAALNGFELNAFRAVLAHEYGHFSNRDTAGGEIAMRVNIDIQRVALSMVESGSATYYNLGFQFLRLFDFLFRRITHGATRLQEVLADRVAAYHFGTAAFQDGLTHVIRKSVEFNSIVDKEIHSAMNAKRPLANLYDLSLEDEAAKTQAFEDINEQMNRPTSDDDTHPSPKDRFRYIKNISTNEAKLISGEVWDLFEDRETITKEMTDFVDKLVSSEYSYDDGSILGI